MGVALAASVLLRGKPLRGSRWLARAAFILMISVGRNKLLDVPTFATSAVLPWRRCHDTHRRHCSSGSERRGRWQFQSIASADLFGYSQPRWVFPRRTPWSLG
jgi:hypothetical protein